LKQQLAAVGIAYVIAGVGTFVLLKVLQATVGLRVAPEVEIQGLDQSEHQEIGYGEQGMSVLDMSTSSSTVRS
jgi:Amt family ammonium transporter